MTDNDNDIPPQIADEFERIAEHVDGYEFNLDPGDGDGDAIDVATWTTNGGTAFATDVVAKNAPKDGPTAVVVGGQHGIEDAGWLAAEEIANLTPTNGRIKVIARADPTAVERGRYLGVEGNMNRQWSIGSDPATPQTRQLWGEIIADDPDIVFDLHSSHGFYADGSGYGQCIYPTPDAKVLAESVADAVSEMVLQDYPDRYEITIGNVQDGSGRPLLSHKVGADLDAMGLLIETARPGTTRMDRVAWTREVVVTALNEFGLRFTE